MNQDVIVIGLGAMGSATLYQLARRGIRALGIDRFRPPHARGSSHGETRITRQAIGEGDRYVPLALRSHELWRELEAETGEALLLACGFLAIDSSGGVSQLHGKPGFMEATVAAARRFGIAHDEPAIDDARRRFPQFIFGETDRVYFEPGGGLVFPEACVRAQLVRAAALGARCRVDEQVLGIDQDHAGVSVRTDRGEYHAAHAIVTAGGWTPGLVGELGAELRLLRQVLHWFRADDLAAFDSTRSPAFIWTHGAGPEDSFYGFPYVAGLTPGVKVATEQYGVTMEAPETLATMVMPEEAAAMHRDHVAGRLRSVRPDPVHGVACFYTMASAGDFIVRRHRSTDRVTLVSACSGHGFKHSAALGEMLANKIAGHDGSAGWSNE